MTKERSEMAKAPFCLDDYEIIDDLSTERSNLLRVRKAGTQRTCVVKIVSESTEQKAETWFYEYIAPNLTCDIIPKCHGVFTIEKRTVFVLDDLGELATPNPDQPGVSNLLELISVDLGKLQKDLENSVRSIPEWLKHWRKLSTRSHIATPQAIKVNAQSLDGEIDLFLRKHKLRKAEVSILNRLNHCWSKAFLNRMSRKSGIRLIHGDFHLGNIFHDSPNERFKVIDWSEIKPALGPHDLAYFLLSFPTPNRVERDTSLLERYWHQLDDPSYDFEDCLLDYRFSLLTNLLQSVVQDSLVWFRKTLGVADAWKAQCLN